METWSYGEEAEPRGFPWPPPEGGSIAGAFGETWRSSTFDPGSFFRRLPPRASLGPALLYYLVIGILVSGISLFWNMTGIMSTAAQSEALASELGVGSFDPVIGFLLSPLMLLFFLFLSAGISHVLLMVFGGARNGFGTTVRVFCYGYSPMIFGIIPIVGALVGLIWAIVLYIIGLREAHGTDGWKAAMAVLLPFVFFIGLMIMAALVFAAAAAALLA